MKTTRLIGSKWKRREACSLRILIGRGLDQNVSNSMKLCSILRIPEGIQETGADDDEDPPVPIPNTEVKLMSVENTWLETAWEDRTVPVRKRNPQGFFFLCIAS